MRRGHFAKALLRLYPQAWRRRYGPEMLALLEDDPPGVRGLCSLVIGAADAHLRPRAQWRGALAPQVRARLSLAGLFCCWIALSLAGGAFAKETEEPSYAAAERHHVLLAVSRHAIIAAAAIGAAAIAIGGLPLLWRALRSAASDRRMAAWVLAPPVALLLFAGVTRLLVALAPAQQAQPSVAGTAGELAILLPFWAAGLLCALCCALAPHQVLAVLPLTRRAIRRAALAGRVLAGAMLTITAALVLYDVALATSVPGLAASSGGPIWPSTALTLAAACALGAVATALGLVAASRASRAAHLLGGA